METWAVWALASALFAALTTIFAKIGLEGINSHFATFIRTIIIALCKAYQVAPIDKLSVVLVAIIAVIFLGERPSLREWLALALIGAGVIILAFK